ncbi:hypothetical protein OG252_08250 [Streptomyces sp. NBC_01352]|uniref:hypothetical protein n=1 Tax=unclassified Streptomyces TaxID=2593676 RepID=UPI00224FD12D|nr:MULTISPECIES: hypothetical protein [unclassified Streptomyces]MCX4705339.1 hypothetical protein [Streptomyces sp. NBC_01373]
MVAVTGLPPVVVGQEPRAETGDGGGAAEAAADLLAEAEADVEADADADVDTDGDGEGDGDDAEPEGDAEVVGENRPLTALPASGPESDDLMRMPPVIAPATNAVATTPIATVRRFVLPRRDRRCRAAL